MNNNIKIAILGYGKMGKEIESIALNHNLIISDVFDINKPININHQYDFDVAIDFTQPDAVLNNVKILADMNKNIVVGTTGWENNFETISNIVKQKNIGLIFGSNFSIGMQLFMRITESAANMINNIDDYDIFLHEIHHNMKKDSPSGTALTLAKIILSKVKNKTQILGSTTNGLINTNQLHVTSTRGGKIAGTHTVYIDSEADTIELTHRAKNRTGFASGAVAAAKWIADKKGIFDFSIVFEDIIKKVV